MSTPNIINKHCRRSTSRALLFSGLFWSLCLLPSCTSLETLVIDVEKPALVTLPNNVNNIIIVDNSIPQPANIGYAEYIKGRKTDTEIEVNTDTLNYTLVSNIFEKIANKDYFNEVVLHKLPIREDNDFEEIQVMDEDLAKSIALENNADAIISLDRFLIAIISNEVDYDYGTRLKSLDAIMDVRFQVYSNEGIPISSPLSISDSIYWIATYNEDIPLLDTLPSREAATIEAAQYMSEKIADALTPYWSNELRWYYGDVKAANKMMANNDWTGALSLWKTAYEKETKNSKKKARLANNIALAYELSDDLREAIKWITISCEQFEKTTETSIDRNNLSKAKAYKDELFERYNDFRLLDMRK